MAQWWKNYPWRVIQTNMREIDVEGLDAERFVEDLRSFHANAVMVSFGGTMANYHSDVEDHYINPRITAETDAELKRLVELCHEAGIKVIARTDFSKMHASVLERHPDWAYREGDDLEVLDSNGYVSTCQSGGFQQAFMDKVITEIIERFKVDGIYCNMGGFMIVDYNVKLHGPCQCDNCRQAFKAQFNMELPKKDVPFANMADPAVQAYQKFKGMVTAAQKRRVAQLIKKVSPDVAYCSVDYVRQESNTEIGRALPHWQYSAASNTRAIIGCGTDADNADVDMMGFSAREASVSPALQEYRLWQALSNFGGLDYFIMGRLDNKKDTSSYGRVRKVFSYAARNERLLLDSRSDAKVLLVRDSYQIPNPEERGWVRFLTESHIPFDETLTASLGGRIKEGYCLIILPEKPRLSAEICSALAEFVSGGGNIVATGKASPALSVLGVQPGKPVSSEGAYIELSDTDRDVLSELSCRGPVPMGKGYISYTRLTARELCRIMPPQCFGPPEVCYCNEEPTGLYGLLINDHGRGKAVYMPWNPGSLYYNEGYDIWMEFVSSVLLDVIGVSQVSRTLSPMVEVTVGRAGDSTVVHLVNGTGHFGTSFFDPVPVDAEFEIPWNKESASIENLDAAGDVESCIRDGRLRVRIPELGFHACIVIS